MLIEHIILSSRAENALVRLAMVVELYENQRFRVFHGLKEKLRLLKTASTSQNLKVRQQLDIFRGMLTREQRRAFVEINLDFWKLEPIAPAGNVHSLEESAARRRQARIYRGARVA